MIFLKACGSVYIRVGRNIFNHRVYNRKYQLVLLKAS